MGNDVYAAYTDGTPSDYQKLVVDSGGNLLCNIATSLVPEEYDYIALTYVAAGDGAGEVETVTYKSGGAGGTTAATLTLAYNASNNLATITRS